MNMFIQKFINRENELKFLKNEYKKDKPFFIVIYGRRRIGKTELIKQFIKDKNAIFFLCTQEVEKENMVSLSEELTNFFNDPTLKISPFSNFKQVMDYLKNKIKSIKTKTIFVIDEFPYLVDANKTIPSLLQKHWDLYFKQSSLGFILCGSSIGAMESKVLGHKSPLYGRRSGQWKVNPLQFKEATQFFPSLDFEKQIEIYSIIGGIPLYLLEIDPKLDLLENIKVNIARKGAFLYDEASFILKEELREPRIYFSLLKEISSGKTKLNNIKNALGVESTLLGRYIETLETLDLIEKQIPVTAKPKSKNTHYYLKDNYFRFWFKFIFPYKKDLERNEFKNLLANLRKELNPFIGHSFEQTCKEYILRMNLPFLINKIGRQWGKIPEKPKNENQYEIDIVALNEKTKDILFAECKWQNNVNAKKLLKDLKEKANYVKWKNDKRKEHYAIFAKSFKEKIKEKNVYLLDINKLTNQK